MTNLPEAAATLLAAHNATAALIAAALGVPVELAEHALCELERDRLVAGQAVHQDQCGAPRGPR